MTLTVPEVLSVLDHPLKPSKTGRSVTAEDLLVGFSRKGGGMGVEVFHRLGLDRQRFVALLGERDAR